MDFYGPSESEFEDYIRKGNIKNDIKIDFIKNIIEYWFDKRERLKKRSNMHFNILLKEERKKDRKKIKAYLKKFHLGKFNKLKQTKEY